MYSLDLTSEQGQLKETAHRFAVEEVVPVALEEAIPQISF
jgi:hypothetical protein